MIWAGDLNWDMSRLTYFSKTMDSFVEKLGLVSLWSGNPVKYTYMHTDNKSVSVLDLFLLSPRLLQLVDECGVIERGDNLSGHCPILVRLKLGKLPVKKSHSSSIPRKPARSKANQEEISYYNSNLEERLMGLSLPLLALSCQDPHCSAAEHSAQ